MTNVGTTRCARSSTQVTLDYWVGRRLFRHDACGIQLFNTVTGWTDVSATGPGAIGSFNNNLARDRADGLHGDRHLQVDAATSAAPEPGAWALMIGGLAMIGAMLRLGRRRTVMAVA
jgi:hypothetical protein